MTVVPHPQEAENRKKQVLDAAAEKQERLEVAFHAAEEASRERRAAAAAQALIERQDAKRESLRKVERQREDNARAEEVRKAQAAVNLAFAEEQATLAEQRRELAVRFLPSGKRRKKSSPSLRVACRVWVAAGGGGGGGGEGGGAPAAGDEGARGGGAEAPRRAGQGADAAAGLDATPGRGRVREGAATKRLGSSLNFRSLLTPNRTCQASLRAATAALASSSSTASLSPASSTCATKSTPTLST